MADYGSLTNFGAMGGVPSNAGIPQDLNSLKLCGKFIEDTKAKVDGLMEQNPIAYAAAGMVPGLGIPINANDAVNHLKDKQYAQAALDALSMVASPVKALSKADYALAMYQYGHKALASQAVKSAIPGLTGLANDSANVIDKIVNK
jgi:hypothetical protein